VTDWNDQDFNEFGETGDFPVESPIDLPPIGEEIARRARRRRRFFFWFQLPAFFLVVGLLIALAGVVAVYIYAKPRYDLAQTFDLSELDDLEVASQIFDRNGRELGRIFVQNRRPVPLEEVSKHFINALLAAEDSRFYDHDGVDYIGVARAIYLNFKSGEMNQGASTITQQLARNTFELKDRSISRKATEAFLARRIESEIGSKQKILELYINRIYFGSGYYGISAASEGFFGKKPSQLSLAEAATLAGVIRNPYYRSPRSFPDASKNTRNQVLSRMFVEDYIDRDTMKRTQSAPIRTMEKGNITGKSAFVYERVRQEVIELLGYEEVSQGGLQIHTTIDGDIQQLAEQTLTERLAMIEEHPDFDHETLEGYKRQKAAFRETANREEKFRAPAYLQGAMMMVDNQTGAILASIGSRDFSDSMFDRTTQGRRPTGTAFLPFVYAAAFEKGLFPGTLLNDTPMDTRQIMIGGTTGILGEWGTEDFENVYEGKITARRALAKSKNAATVSLGQRTGLDRVVSLAEEAGLSLEGELKQFNATFLGRNPNSLAELCLAYTIFPNQGRRPEKSYIISDIRDRAGNVIYSPSVTMARGEIIDRYTAHQINSSLADSFDYGTARKARENYDLGDFPVAGKTGTEYDFTDNWFVGYTSEVTCAVWAGFDQNTTIFPGAFSSDTVLPIWTEVMNAAAKKYPPRAFLPPPDAEQAEICLKSGELASDGCYETVQDEAGRSSQVRCTYVEYLRPGTDLSSICSIHGGPGSRLKNRMTQSDPGGPLRAMPALLADAEPVIPVAPTVVGNSDPYRSVAPRLRARVAVPMNSADESGDEEEIGANGLPVARPVIDTGAAEEAETIPDRVALPAPRAIQFD